MTKWFYKVRVEVSASRDTEDMDRVSLKILLDRRVRIG